MTALMPSTLLSPIGDWTAPILQEIGRRLTKMAEMTVSYDLAGRLYLSSTGYLMLSVPNALVRGVYSALDEHGLELPPTPEGQLNGHISVMRPEEIAALGGAEKITERGKTYAYTLGRLYTTEPEGWKDMDRVWMIRIHSPELQALRRSYGLSSLPNEGKYDFHCTVAVRRKGVLARNDKSKSN